MTANSQAPRREAISLDIVICTYNNARGLDEVLHAISELRSPAQMDWAVLIVDNASTDATREVARAWAERGLLRLRYVFEGEQGLTPARLRAVRETTREWIAFVDDDNLLDPGWLEAMAEAIHADPAAGSFGGRVELVWDAPPPAAVQHFGFCFAEQSLGPAPCEVESLVGAGMVLKREALERCGWTAEPLLADRAGRRLVSGGDAEIALRLRAAGYRLRYAPAASMRHRMSARRATRRYLLQINHALGRAAVRVSLLTWPGEFAAWRDQERGRIRARQAQAWRGLLWSLAARRELTAALAWLALAFGHARGLRDLEALGARDRSRLMGRAAPGVATEPATPRRTSRKTSQQSSSGPPNSDPDVPRSSCLVGLQRIAPS
jgi:glucosyl-dolichyl phosphate glucuronosyltransferase